MFCTNCGEELENGYQFCLNCGEKIDFLDITNTESADLKVEESADNYLESAPVAPFVPEAPAAARPKKVVVTKVKVNPDPEPQESAIMRFCTNCGELLEPGFQFCTNCGASINGSDSTASVAETPKRKKEKKEKVPKPPKEKKQPKEKAPTTKGQKAQNIAIAVLTLLALLLGTILCFAWTGSNLDLLPGGDSLMSEVEITDETKEGTTKNSDSSTNGGDTQQSPAMELRNENNEWYAYYNGNKVADYNGFISNDMGDWYVKNGKVDFLADGVFARDAEWVKVTKGKVDYSFTGVASNEYGKWYVESGLVDFSFSGDIVFAGTTYKVVSGRVQ